jgi:hypothetical protein
MSGNVTQTHLEHSSAATVYGNAGMRASAASELQAALDDPALDPDDTLTRATYQTRLVSAILASRTFTTQAT